MPPHEAINLGREAILIGLVIVAPVLLVGTAVGLLIGLIQALTQIQDQTISFVPKIVAMAVALAITLPWLIRRLVAYSEDLITNIPNLLMGS